jgi:hypothetical protein
MICNVAARSLSMSTYVSYYAKHRLMFDYSVLLFRSNIDMFIDYINIDDNCTPESIRDDLWNFSEIVIVCVLILFDVL